MCYPKHVHDNNHRGMYGHLSATTEPSVDMCTDNHMMDFTCSHQSDSNRHITGL